MELAQLRTRIFDLASNEIYEWFDPNDHSVGQKYCVKYGEEFCKLMIYRNCFEPCMSYATYFEDYHILYSDVIEDEYIQTSFYINRNSDGSLSLPDPKFKVQRARTRQCRRTRTI